MSSIGIGSRKERGELDNLAEVTGLDGDTCRPFAGEGSFVIGEASRREDGREHHPLRAENDLTRIGCQPDLRYPIRWQNTGKFGQRTRRNQEVDDPVAFTGKRERAEG